MTYSVYDIRIDNSINFPPGPTAGYVLSINADGSTYWSEGGSNTDTVTSDTITTLWSGTQIQYDALGTYSNTTIYFIK